MGIFKESLPAFVRKQIRVREGIMQLGNNPTQNRGQTKAKSFQLGNPNKESQTEIDAGAFHVWNTTKSCTVRMASCVDLTDKDILEIAKNNPAINRLAEKDLLGPGLALTYILEGGTIIKGAKTARVKNDKGGYDKKLSINETSLKRRGFPGFGRPLGGVYGDPIVRGDAKDGYGIVPMPGIVKMDVATKSAYGSLREAKVEFVCHNLRQLEILELLYMRPGYPVLLEWAWTPYVDNNGKTQTKVKGGYISEKEKFWTKGMENSQIFINDAIFQRRNNNSGCYDGLLGLVKNFSFKLRPDGGFNCTTELMGMGEVLASLKGNMHTMIDPGGVRRDVPMIQNFIDKSIDYMGMRQINFRNDSDLYTGNDKVALGGGIQTEQEVSSDGELVEDDHWYDDIDFEFESEDYRPVFQVDQNGNFVQGQPKRARFTPQQVRADYRAEFFDKVNGQALFDDTYLVSLKEGRKYWKDNIKALYDKIATNTPTDTALLNQLQKIKLSESYIRLDALCYIINKYCMEKIPKSTKRGVHGGNNFTSFQTVLYAPHKPSGKRLKPSLLNKYSGKIRRLLKDVPDEIVDVSVDPYVCLLPRQAPHLPKTTGTSAKYGGGTNPNNQSRGTKGDKYKNAAPNPYGYFKNLHGSEEFKQHYEKCTRKFWLNSIGHILVNIDMLQRVHADLYDAGKSDDYSIGAFMKAVLDKINSALGDSHNLTLQTDNSYPHVGIIVDLSCDIDNSVKGIDDVFEIQVQSNKSAVRNFSYNSSIPSSMTATIAIGAAAADDPKSLDQVTFASMNRGISNRLYNPKPPVRKEKPTAEEIQKAKDLRTKQENELNEKVSAVARYLIQIYTGQYFRKSSRNRKKELNIMKRNLDKIHNLTDTLLQLDDEALPKFTPPSNTPVPIKIDLEFDGLSGIVMGQLFRVDESRLPRHYRDKNIHFIVMGEKQEVTTGGDWTTTISGQMQVFPTPMAKREAQKTDFKPKQLDFYRGANSGGGGYTPNWNTTCFVKGTKVTMANGTYKNIENIKEGDEILSYNVSTKEFGTDKVLPLPEILNNYQKIIATYENGTKNEFSPAHPFYIEGKGWASYDLTDTIITTGDCGDGRLENDWNIMFKEGKLHQLEVGDYCVDDKGKKLKITSLEETNEYVDMYNLEFLDNNKTWFANGILVKE